MPASLIWILALLAAVTQMISILNWLKVGPDKLFNREWWKTREVTITKGKFAVISLLGFISLALSAYGFYVMNKQEPVPRMLQWGAANRHCTVVVDTSPIKSMSNEYFIVMACGIVDSTIDQLEDQRILLSGPFNILGGPQAISAVSTPDFDKLVQSFGPNASVPIWEKVFLIPKDRNTTEIHKLSEVPRINGKLF